MSSKTSYHKIWNWKTRKQKQLKFRVLAREIRVVLSRGAANKSFVSRTYEVSARGATSEDHLLVSGMEMKLWIEKHLDSDKGRNTEAGATNVTRLDSFDPSHHLDDLERSCDDSDWERVEGSGRASDRSETNRREELSFKERLDRKKWTIVRESNSL